MVFFLVEMKILLLGKLGEPHVTYFTWSSPRTIGSWHRIFFVYLGFHVMVLVRPSTTTAAFITRATSFSMSFFDFLATAGAKRLRRASSTFAATCRCSWGAAVTDADHALADKLLESHGSQTSQDCAQSLNEKEQPFGKV